MSVDPDVNWATKVFVHDDLVLAARHGGQVVGLKVEGGLGNALGDV